MKEAIENVEVKPHEKLKVTKADIIVTGTKKKPYFEIKYKEAGKKHYNIGYGSYDLNNVFKWREEEMEIVSEVEAEYEEDVCEWRWGVDRAMVQCKGDYIIFESRRLFSFCPYCGKKIKVVE